MTDRSAVDRRVSEVLSVPHRAYFNSAVQPILCSPGSRLCNPRCKIVQSKKRESFKKRESLNFLSADVKI